MRHTSRKAIVNTEYRQLLFISCQCRRWTQGVGKSVIRFKKKVRINQLLMAVAFLIAITSTAFTELTQAAQELPIRGQGQEQDAVATYQLNLPRQTLAAALTTLSEQTDIQVLFPYDIAKSHSIKPMQGYYSIQQALELMLQDSGLYGGLTDSGVITISQADTNSGTNQNGKGKRMNITTKKSLLATMIALFASGATVQTVAQSDENRPAKAHRALDEIIVTAEKREQNLQDIPVAISVFSADKLKNSGLESPLDLQFAVPGLAIRESTTGGASITIRGVGGSGTVAGGDPGVTSHIDGHYTQFTSYLLKDFFDVERVEVQRGPQGTLYGRNATGGNINIISKRPTDELETTIGIDIGNYNKRKLQGVVSGPLMDGVRGRLAFSDETRDGFVENISNGDSYIDSDYTSIRASLEYDLTENIDIFLSAFHFKDDGISFATRLAEDYPSTGIFANNVVPYNNITLLDPQKVRANDPVSSRDEAEGVSVDLSWDLGSVTFESLSAYNDAAMEVVQDLDGSDINLLNQKSIASLQSFTQEFQLLSSENSNLTWILGAFYYKEKSENYFDITLASTLLAPPFTNGDPLDMIFTSPVANKTESVATFAQFNYSFTDKLTLTAGLRYTRDKKDFEHATFFGPKSNFILPSPTEISDEWSKTTGKLSLDYSITEEQMLYFTYAQGFIAGGFTSSTTFKPELVDSYEFGMKGTYLENKLQLNMATFYNDYTNKVESVIGEVLTATTNAAGVVIKGVELEIKSWITDSLLIDSSLSYQNPEYSDFDTKDPSAPTLGVQSLSGNNLALVPEKKFNLGAQYEWQLTGNLGSLVARADYAWVDEQFRTKFNKKTLDSYEKINARLKWKSRDDHWNADLYVLNLKDDQPLTAAVPASGILGFAVLSVRLPPRTYGVSVNYNF